MDNRKALTPRAKEMYGVIEKYFKSGLQQRSFCEKIDLNLGTFQKWLYYYRKDNPNRKKKERITEADFIPIEIQPKERSKKVSMYTIEYPNGVTLRMNGSVAISELRELLKVES